MKKFIKTSSFLILILVLAPLLTALDVNIRTSDNEGFTRIVFEADRSFAYAVQNRPGQMQVRLSGRAAFPARSLAWPDSPLLERLTYEIQGNESVFTVFFKGDAAVKKSFVLEKPFRVVFDLGKSEKPAAATTAAGASPDKKPDPAPGKPAGAVQAQAHRDHLHRPRPWRRGPGRPGQVQAAGEERHPADQPEAEKADRSPRPACASS